MKKLKFNKEENGKWYIDLPEWTGEKSALEMVLGADKLLDRLSVGKETVTLLVSEVPIEGDWHKIKKIMDTPIVGGAIYMSKWFPIWLCEVTEFVYDGRMPDVLYYQVADLN